MQQRTDHDEPPKDPEWSDAFLEKVSRFVRRIGRKRRYESDVTEDIAQDVVMMLLERIRDGRMTEPPPHARPLVLRMIRQLAIIRSMKDDARDARQLEWVTQPGMEARPWMDPDETLRERELDAARARVIERLPDTERSMFVLARDEEMGCAGAARRLGVTRKVARRQLAAAEAEFRRELTWEDVPVPPAPKWRSRTPRMRPRYRKTS